jgi:hypothetical protein
VAGNARSTGGEHLIRGQKVYPSRSSLEAECPLPEIPTPVRRAGAGNGARVRSEAPARAERRRQQLPSRPTATAPVLDSTREGDREGAIVGTAGVRGPTF